MQFVILDRLEFDQFSKQHFKHYTQSIKLYDYRYQKNNDAHIVGVKNEKQEIIAACLLTEARILKFYKYFYTHRGPILDFNDIKLVRFFFEKLEKYVRKHHGIYILADPYLIENKRDYEGKIIKQYDNTEVTNILSQIGYRHQGYSIGYSNMSQIRWISILNIGDKTEKQILKEMSYQTRRNIKKTIDMGVNIKTLSTEEVSRFYTLFQMAEEKHGFKFREESYFKQMLEIYQDQAVIKLAYIDLNEYLDQLQVKKKLLQNQIKEVKHFLNDNPNSKKNKNTLKQLESQIDSIESKVVKTKQTILNDGEILDLAAALFISTNDEVYYLSSGSNPKYNEYMGAYRLQWDMIKYAIKNRIPRYNFYGITGEFGESAEDYGVQQFKKGFNTYVEELIGDFIIPIRPLLYKISTKR